MSKMELILNIVQIVISVVAIIFAIYIPIRIMNFQRYTNLSTTYMGLILHMQFKVLLSFSTKIAIVM